MRMLRLSKFVDGADDFKAHFETFAASGGSYANIYIDLTEGFDESAEFQTDSEAARIALERRLKEMLRALKYGAQHMARADGGRIWVLCYDHSVSFSVMTPSNPITNYAAMAAVQCVAKEVAHFDVMVNLFMIHPPSDTVEPPLWRQARNSLHVYRLKYKPQSASQISELLHMYAGIEHLSTTGGVIPVGSGIAACNF
ncbi:MAG: hypothetical protein LBQ20_06530 [Rhodanobacter sp.]|nr:hypothetical protein [Rhodanobacter sp.]